MSLNFATDPIPHEEAVKRIADKPAVARDVFDRLPEEMQARAFTIAGIEDMDAVQAVRDRLAMLPAGGDWNKVKREIAEEISPWFTPEGAAARSELLMRHHAFSAYSATQARIMDEMIDVFPFRQYLSTKDGKVRASHAALHEIILPANHDFWTYHTPPWEWNCRCQVVELTEEDRDEEHARDQKRAPEKRRVLEGPNLKQLETGSLNRGLSTNVDVRTPKERGGNYQWSARDQSMPYAEIRKRWDSDLAADFEAWSGKMKLDSGRSLLEQLTGKPAPAAVPAPAAAPAPTSAPTPRGNAKPASYQEAVRALKLEGKDKWTRRDIANLRSALRVSAPAKQADHVAGITGTKTKGALTETQVRRAVQDVLNLLPRSVADTLPKVSIELTGKSIGGTANGMYLPDTVQVQVTSRNMRAGMTQEQRRREFRRILSHELMHWVHLSATGPGADAYRQAITDHFNARTAGDSLVMGSFLPDQWWDLYAGKLYPRAERKYNCRGLEVPTRYYELWASPDILAAQLDPAQSPAAAAHRETFALVHSFFDLPTP